MAKRKLDLYDEISEKLQITEHELNHIRYKNEVETNKTILSLKNKVSELESDKKETERVLKQTNEQLNKLLQLCVVK